MNDIRHARLIRFLLMYLIYGRVFILAFFPVMGLIALFKLPDRYYAYWALCFGLAFLLPTAILIGISFIPKCPFCAKSVCIVPLRGPHPNFPKLKGFWKPWFGEVVEALRSEMIQCHHCGAEVRLKEPNNPVQPTAAR